MAQIKRRSFEIIQEKRIRFDANSLNFKIHRILKHKQKNRSNPENMKSEVAPRNLLSWRRRGLLCFEVLLSGLMGKTATRSDLT